MIYLLLFKYIYFAFFLKENLLLNIVTLFLYQEYLARLGIDTRAPHLSHTSSYQTLEAHSDVYNRLQVCQNISVSSDLVPESIGKNSVWKY